MNLNMNPNMMININQNMIQNMNLNQNRFKNMNQNRLQNMNQNMIQNMNQNYILPNQVNINQNYGYTIPKQVNMKQNYGYNIPNQVNMNQNYGYNIPNQVNMNHNYGYSIPLIPYQMTQKYTFSNQINMNQNNKSKQNINNNIMISNMMNNNNISEKKILLENIQKQDNHNQLVYYSLIKQIINSNIDKCVCKIITKNKKGTGFFCDVRQKSIKILITNNHVIDKTFLDSEKKLNYSITENNTEILKEINLEKERYKYTDEKLDFTIIEILKEDNINNYLEINNNIYNINDQIFSFQYPKGGKLKYTHGKIIRKQNDFLIYDVDTRGGSSGSPIILMNNSKIIGLHKGYLEDNSNKINIGISIELIINKINNNNISYIKCTYEIKDNNYIQIINNRDTEDVNEEIESKIKIWNNGKKKI